MDWAGPNGVGFSHIIGIGDNADLGFGVALDWLSRDPGTGAILLDVRRIKNRRAFLSAARAASRLRPVVAIRAGVRLLDPSGAGELAFEAALRRAGVLCVSAAGGSAGGAETLSRARPARGEALAIVSNCHQRRADGGGRRAARWAAAALLSPETEAVLRMRLAPPHRARIGRHPGSPTAYLVGADAPRCGRDRGAARRRARSAASCAHAPTGETTAAIAALAACNGTVELPLLVCRDGRNHRRRASPPPGAGRRGRLRHAGTGGARLSCIWCRTGATAPRRASCRTARGRRSAPDRTRCAACSPRLRAAGRLGHGAGRGDGGAGRLWRADGADAAR